MTRAEFDAAYAFRYQHEVEFGEVDMLRHVNNVCYATWAETARTRYFADVLERDIGGSEGLILARHDLTYDAPVGYRERIVVGARVVRWGTKSFDFETVVFVPERERIAFRSRAVLVAYDYGAERTIAVPAAWRARVAAFEGPPPA